MKKLWIIALGAAVALTGCTKKDLIERQNNQIESLNQDVSELHSEVQRLENTNQDLRSSLENLRKEKSVLVDQRDGLMHITLDGAARFATAKATLTADAKDAIDRIADVLQDYPDRWILVEGHADRRSIADTYKWKYPSNWELSAARANAVVHYLISNHNIDPQRLKSVGMGDLHPASDGDTPEARATNRRVEIVVGSRTDIENRMAARSK